jgi:hypothetical protein
MKELLLKRENHEISDAESIIDSHVDTPTAATDKIPQHAFRG